MRENINKVSQRGERLDSLQDKTDNLAVSAQGFRRGANRVRKQMWWKDMKMRMCLIVGIIILLIVIIVPAGKPDFYGCLSLSNRLTRFQWLLPTTKSLSSCSETDRLRRLPLVFRCAQEHALTMQLLVAGGRRSDTSVHFPGRYMSLFYSP